MILIAHRGNVDGPEPERENSYEHINNALNRGFDVEIDVWYHENNWYLGHDEPKYTFGWHWLKHRNYSGWVNPDWSIPDKFYKK